MRGTPSSGVRGCLYVADSAPVSLNNVDLVHCGKPSNRKDGILNYIKDTQVPMQGALTQGSGQGLSCI